MKVAIVVGSESDLPTLEPCVATLRELGLPVVQRVLSAHRTPEEATHFAKTAVANGIGIVIAAAGLAAHLPGVLAAHTHLPVIGVPMASGSLQGMDALLSMAQMPPGVPVATVGIGAAKNAAILAAQILSLGDEALRARLLDWRKDMRAKVLQHPLNKDLD